MTFSRGGHEKTVTLSVGGLSAGLVWLGGAVWTANQPGMTFWDGMVWLYYVGRFIARFAMPS